MLRKANRNRVVVAVLLVVACAAILVIAFVELCRVFPVVGAVCMAVLFVLWGIIEFLGLLEIGSAIHEAIRNSGLFAYRDYGSRNPLGINNRSNPSNRS